MCKKLWLLLVTCFLSVTTGALAQKTRLGIQIGAGASDILITQFVPSYWAKPSATIAMGITLQHQLSARWALQGELTFRRQGTKTVGWSASNRSQYPDWSMLGLPLVAQFYPIANQLFVELGVEPAARVISRNALVSANRQFDVAGIGGIGYQLPIFRKCELYAQKSFLLTIGMRYTQGFITQRSIQFTDDKGMPTQLVRDWFNTTAQLYVRVSGFLPANHKKNELPLKK